MFHMMGASDGPNFMRDRRTYRTASDYAGRDHLSMSVCKAQFQGEQILTDLYFSKLEPASRTEV
jgi:hypothetical protein